MREDSPRIRLGGLAQIFVSQHLGSKQCFANDWNHLRRHTPRFLGVILLCVLPAWPGTSSTRGAGTNMTTTILLYSKRLMPVLRNASELKNDFYLFIQDKVGHLLICWFREGGYACCNVRTPMSSSSVRLPKWDLQGKVYHRTRWIKEVH